jgi:hypothetical protein
VGYHYSGSGGAAIESRRHGDRVLEDAVEDFPTQTIPGHARLWRELAEALGKQVDDPRLADYWKFILEGKPEIYIQRSPLYHVDKLQVPLLVHVATNDTDVNYVEDQQIVDALRSRKPDLAETKTYVDPPTWGPSGGHAFSRRVDPKTLQRVDSPEQIDSWNRTWTFFEWNLRKR